MFFSNIKEIDAPQLAEWVQDGKSSNLRVIDVRQMQEIAGGTVPKAEAFPLHLLQAKLHELSQDETVVVVCRSGARSAQACMFLLQNGFSKVFNLRGGMMSWSQSGYAAAPLAS